MPLLIRSAVHRDGFDFMTFASNMLSFALKSWIVLSKQSTGVERYHMGSNYSCLYSSAVSMRTNLNSIFMGVFLET